MRRLLKGAIVCLLLTIGSVAGARQYSWQQSQAAMLPTGDLLWAPHAFEFHAGAVVRYIDFDGGDDRKDGATRDTPWKHHPWDLHATGNAYVGA